MIFFLAFLLQRIKVLTRGSCLWWELVGSYYRNVNSVFLRTAKGYPFKSKVSSMIRLAQENKKKNIQCEASCARCALCIFFLLCF